MLKSAGIPVEVHPADLDERALQARAAPQKPAEVAALLAKEKATVVGRVYPGRLVLGADQTLALGAEHFAKPTDRNAARAQLRALSGKRHALHSAIAFVQDGAVLFEQVDTAQLTMRMLSDRFLDLYLDTLDEAAAASVGAYQLEGLGSQLFERVEGDYFTILGLPLLAVLDFLRRHECLAS